jgi:2-isopropylmalate synthase
MESQKNVLVYDATLRESMQALGIRLNCDAMIQLAEKLDAYGVDFIEAGWPGASRVWNEFFQRVAEGAGPVLKRAKLVAFSSTHRAHKRPEDDEYLQMLVESPVDIVTIFGKTWPVHVVKAIRTTPENNLKLIEDSVRMLVRAGKTVFFDAEHFFQSVLKGERAYAIEALGAAEAGGASQLVLCDTNGVACYWDIEEAVSSVARGFPNMIIGVHLHGDRGMATANTIAAIRAGARHVQGTLNGYSERVQMACTIEVLANVFLLTREHRLSGVSIAEAYHPEKSQMLSREMDRLCGVSPYERKAIVGECDGTHKAGVHGSAVLRDEDDDGLYQSHDPALFGGCRRIVLSSMAGRANVISMTKEYWDVPFFENNPIISNVLQRVEELEEQGCRLDVCNGSAAVLIAEMLWPSADIGWKSIAEEPHLVKDARKRSIATIVFCDGTSACSIGDGPVDAMMNVVKGYYAKQCPSLLDLQLTEYNSKNLDRSGSKGSASFVRVEIKWTHSAFGVFRTHGVTTDQDLSAWRAIEEAFKFVFFKDWRCHHPVSERP